MSAPLGYENKDFKYIDDDSASECSEYSHFDEYDYIPEEKKKVSVRFKKIMTKEEFLPE